MRRIRGGLRMDQRWGSGASLEWRRALTGDDKKVDGGQESKMRARKASLIYSQYPDLCAPVFWHPAQVSRITRKIAIAVMYRTKRKHPIGLIQQTIGSSRRPGRSFLKQRVGYKVQKGA